MEERTTVRVRGSEAREALRLTGARNRVEAFRALLDEARRTRARRRLLERAGTIDIEYVRAHDRGRR